MPANPGPARLTRLCAGLTVAGGTVLICGLAAGLVGEVSRLTGQRHAHLILTAAEVLVIAGLICGAALLGTAAVWHMSIHWQPPQPQINFAPGPPLPPHQEPPPGLIGTPAPLACTQAAWPAPAPPKPAQPGVPERAPEVAHYPPHDPG